MQVQQKLGASRAMKASRNVQRVFAAHSDIRKEAALRGGLPRRHFVHVSQLLSAESRVRPRLCHAIYQQQHLISQTRVGSVTSARG